MTLGDSVSTYVVATAGHVDHGKSTLVLGLTGVDPDRWAEEKARGLTIDLGFAQLPLDASTNVSIVDVPGHIRFLKNMLAGVGAIDACLFVVAATEGWKPQSEEHLRILELLGISKGVIALTKAGLVDEEWAELARLDVADHVKGTFLEEAEIVLVDTPTNLGIDQLRSALLRLLRATPVATDRSRPRLWVDRVFAAKGAGTVVTGTLTLGHLQTEQEVVIVGPTAGQSPARIRSIQSHGQTLDRVRPGNRVAINLNGITHDQIARGDALVLKNQWQLTTRFDASLRVLQTLDHEVSRRGAFAIYAGAGEYHVKVRILGTSALTAGETGVVRIHLPVPLPLQPGDRFVLRDHGREETVGGGEVLDVAPVRPASKASPSKDPRHLVAERRWVLLDDFARLSGGLAWDGPILAKKYAVDPGAIDTEKIRLRALVDEAGPLGYDVSALDDRRRAVLELLSEEGIVVDSGKAKREEVADPLASHPFVQALEADLFRPPDANGVDRSELRELIRRNYVIERDGVHFSPKAITEAARLVAELLATRPDGVTVADVRDRVEATRKHVLPLLAHLDATGITRRRGDFRIAGPRLPVLD
jgi:selenocysteine-specific elongation factor